MLKICIFVMLIIHIVQSFTSDIVPKVDVSTLNGVGNKPSIVGTFYFMKKICGIYKITSPIKRIYIGQSINITKRWNEYEKYHCKKQLKLYRSLKKYGWEKHKFEIIHQCASEQLNELEKYYVDLFQTFNSEYGLNLKDGGGEKGKLSEETKRKMSISRMGHKGYNKGKKHSEESRKKISNSLKIAYQNGKIKKSISLEARKKISETLKRNGIKPKIRFNSTGFYNVSKSKRIINTETNEIFIGIKSVINKFHLWSYQQLCRMLNGYTKNKTTFQYTEIQWNKQNYIKMPC